MKLNIDIFNEFDAQIKSDMLSDFGQLLTRVDTGEIEIYLYHLVDFYVEVHLQQASMEILKYCTFKTIDPLDPLLQSVDLRKLM
jgi:hypothetical protein